MTTFSGPFAQLLEGFIELKRSTGFKYVKEAAYLKRFGEFSISQGITDNAYIPVNQAHIRQRKSEFSVYVFTHGEMDAIFDQSNRIYPHRRSTMHLVLPILIRLLYSTGLRIMEALHLQLQDVNLSDGILRIANAKFNKDRLIPISESMHAILKNYCGLMHPLYRPEDYLFIGTTRSPYSHHEVYYRFRELLVMANIPHAGRGYGPRIHDIRHTFCCHTLQKAVAAKKNLTNMLPLLSEYLGHESLAATSRYLRMTSEVYPDVQDAVERLCAYVIPEVVQ